MRILITGANRGLGYEFVKQYLDRGDEVIAAARVPQDAEMLGTLEQKYDNLLALYKLDVTDLKSIQAMREIVETRFESRRVKKDPFSGRTIYRKYCRSI